MQLQSIVPESLRAFFAVALDDFVGPLASSFSVAAWQSQHLRKSNRDRRLTFGAFVPSPESELAIRRPDFPSCPRPDPAALTILVLQYAKTRIAIFRFSMCLPQFFGALADFLF